MGNTWFSYKNIPNTLSLLRIALVLPFVLIIHDIFVYECTKNLGLVIIFFTIIISDIADGYVARKLNCMTKAGAKLDVISDTVYTILSATAFAYFHIIPVWFVVVLILKLVEFIVTSTLLTGKLNSETAVSFDKIGKASVCIVMVLPGLFVFRCIILDYKIVMRAVIYIITLLFLLSSITRIKNTIESIKR